MGDLEVRTVVSADAYRALRPQLLDLFRGSGAPWSAVAHPDWVEAWWRSRPPRRHMECAIVFRGGSAIAAFPFEYVERLHLPVRKVTSTNLGWGWSSALVADEGSLTSRALVDWLKHDARRWSVLELGLFPPQSAITGALSRLADQTGWHPAALSRDMASLPLPGSYDQWYAERSKHLRRKIRRTQAKAASLGLTVHTREGVTASELSAVVGPVSLRSWQGARGVAVFSDPLNRDFYVYLTQAEDLTVILHHVEDADGAPLAYVLAVRTEGVVHHIDTGFDQTAADYSPGLSATVEAVRWACANGASEIDLGVHADYKDRFDATIRHGEGIQINRGLGGLIARARSDR